jgi:hypothetical protein
MKKNIKIKRRNRGTIVRIDKLRPAAKPGWYKRFRQLLDKSSGPKLN